MASLIASMMSPGESASIADAREPAPSQLPEWFRPCSRRPGSCSLASQTIEAMSMGSRHWLSSWLRRARAIPCTRLGSTWPAISQPRWSSNSKALLAKSNTCPPSR